MACDCLPYAASIWPTDCQAVTSCTPIPDNVDAHDGSWSGRSVAASSITRSRGGSRGLPVWMKRSKAWPTRSLCMPPSTGRNRCWSLSGMQT